MNFLTKIYFKKAQPCPQNILICRCCMTVGSHNTKECQRTEKQSVCDFFLVKKDTNQLTEQTVRNAVIHQTDGSLSKTRTHFWSCVPNCQGKNVWGIWGNSSSQKTTHSKITKINATEFPQLEKMTQQQQKTNQNNKQQSKLKEQNQNNEENSTIEQQRYQQNSFRTPQNKWADNNNLAAKIQAQKEMASDVSFQALTLQQKAKNLTEQSSSDPQQIIEKMADLLNKPIELFMGTMNKILRNEFSISSVPTDKQQEKRQKISTNNACYVHWRKSILHEYTGCHRTKTVSSNTTTATTTTTTTTTTTNKQQTNKKTTNNNNDNNRLVQPLLIRSLQLKRVGLNSCPISENLTVELREDTWFELLWVLQHCFTKTNLTLSCCKKSVQQMETSLSTLLITCLYIASTTLRFLFIRTFHRQWTKFTVLKTAISLKLLKLLFVLWIWLKTFIFLLLTNTLTTIEKEVLSPL